MADRVASVYGQNPACATLIWAWRILCTLFCTYSVDVLVSTDVSPFAHVLRLLREIVTDAGLLCV